MYLSKSLQTFGSVLYSELSWPVKTSGFTASGALSVFFMLDSVAECWDLVSSEPLIGGNTLFFPPRSSFGSLPVILSRRNLLRASSKFFYEREALPSNPA